MLLAGKRWEGSQTFSPIWEKYIVRLVRGGYGVRATLTTGVGKQCRLSDELVAQKTPHPKRVGRLVRLLSFSGGIHLYMSE